jgi:hypothetical protein
MSDHPEWFRRRAAVLLDETLLHDLLQVPHDGTRIVGTTFDALRMCVIIHLESPHLPLVDPSEMSPIIQPITHQEEEICDCGRGQTRTTVEWPWQTPAKE